MLLVEPFTTSNILINKIAGKMRAICALFENTIKREEITLTNMED